MPAAPATQAQAPQAHPVARPATHPLARANTWLTLLLAAFVALGGVYAVVTPLFEISDELWHYPMVKRLADGRGLPVQDPANPGPWRQEGSQPPLYYALMALATAWIDTSDIDQVRWVNPHADNGIITPDRNNNIVVHTYREAWPWTGTVLAVRLIRLLSVLLAAGTVYFTYRLGREVVPGRPGVALAAAGLVAFTPMFVFISASVNNDNLAIVLSAATLWLLARWVRRGAPIGLAEPAAAGLLLGAGALSKSSALGLWPLAGAALVAAAFCQRRRPATAGGRQQGAGGSNRIQPDFEPAGRRFISFSLSPSTVLFRLLPGLVTMYAVAGLVSGWWFLRNRLLYGDWLGWSAFLATVGARPQPATLAQLWGERAGFVQAYWGLFGGVSVPMPGWSYLVLNGMAALAVVGLLWGALRAARRATLADVALWGLVGGWLLVITVSLVRWTSLTWASQGRLVFPAISAIGLLLAAGLAALWRWLPAVAVGGMAVLAVAVPFTVIAPAYAAPPELAAADLEHLPNPLDRAGDFGGEMALLGYRLETAGAAPGESLHLTLFWQAQAAMDRNWSIFVHVVDEAGIIIAQRDRYPGEGTLATTLLRPGQTWAERYVIPIPDAAYAPVGAHLEVGLYDLADGARLPPGGPAPGDPAAEALVLAPVQIEARPVVMLRGLGEVPNAFGQNFGNQIELVGYAMDRRVLAPGETLRLRLYWRALADLDVNYSVFAHVRGEGESLFGGHDGWPQDGAAPTAAWRRGEVFVDEHPLPVLPGTPPGTYAVEVGLYDSQGARLQAVTDDGRTTDADYVFLSRIRVTP